MPTLSPTNLRVLRLYNLYRVTLGLVLVLLSSSQLDLELLEPAHLEMFRLCSWGYLIFNTLIAIFVQRPLYISQLFSLALIDVVLLCGLFYASGGVNSGLGNLMVVSVAITNMLLRGRIGLLIAAIAAIGMLGMTGYLSFIRPTAASQFVQTGVLGALCFAAAFVIQGLSKRLQQSESLAEQCAADVANLQELNAQILQRMRTGIMVVDRDHRILLANQGAQHLLGQQHLEQGFLGPLCPPLLQRLQQWQYNPTLRAPSLQARPDGPTLQASFIALQRGEELNTLVFLDDLSEITQQAQQLKLASLGRLTAGIAHEVRNPLGAISHAAQLLQESENLDNADRRLTQIIHDHTLRMNAVIENVLQLSRRRQSEPQLLDLKYWVHRFASEFNASARPNQTLHIETNGSSLQTRMDPHQLNQVLTNLVQNGMRFSAQRHNLGQVWLKLYRDAESDLPRLDIIDNGSGVPPELQANIFEPFYTTDSKGTGLGLYISRELCESNQAHLDYHPHPDGGSCFRITFAHPRKLS